MTTLEHGKFIKIFVRDTEGRKIPKSHFRGYSKSDVEAVKPKIDDIYWDRWEQFLADKKANTDWQKDFVDWPHYLYKLNSVDDADIKKYKLPEGFIAI